MILRLYFSLLLCGVLNAEEKKGAFSTLMTEVKVPETTLWCELIVTRKISDKTEKNVLVIRTKEDKGGEIVSFPFDEKSAYIFKVDSDKGVLIIFDKANKDKVIALVDIKKYLIKEPKANLKFGICPK